MYPTYVKFKNKTLFLFLVVINLFRLLIPRILIVRLILKCPVTRISFMIHDLTEKYIKIAQTPIALDSHCLDSRPEHLERLVILESQKLEA